MGNLFILPVKMPADIPISKSVINSGSIFNNSFLTGFFIILQIINPNNLKFSTMKTKTIYSILFLIILLPASSIIAQKANFSGEWKINKEKSVLTDNQLFLSKITIQLKNDSLLTTRVYENGNGDEYPFDEKLSLDGMASKIVIFEMPRTSKATLSDTDGSIMIASTTTFNGGNGQEDMTANEKWKVENEGQNLSFFFTNKMSGNEITGTYYYDKVK